MCSCTNYTLLPLRDDTSSDTPLAVIYHQWLTMSDRSVWFFKLSEPPFICSLKDTVDQFTAVAYSTLVLSIIFRLTRYPVTILDVDWLWSFLPINIFAKGLLFNSQILINVIPSCRFLLFVNSNIPSVFWSIIHIIYTYDTSLIDYVVFPIPKRKLNRTSPCLKKNLNLLWSCSKMYQQWYLTL